MIMYSNLGFSTKSVGFPKVLNCLCCDVFECVIDSLYEHIWLMWLKMEANYGIEFLT